jgi:hypothetical protein
MLYVYIRGKKNPMEINWRSQRISWVEPGNVNISHPAISAV